MNASWQHALLALVRSHQLTLRYDGTVHSFSKSALVAPGFKENSESSAERIIL